MKALKIGRTRRIAIGLPSAGLMLVLAGHHVKATAVEEPVEPVLALSINAGAEIGAFRGWPLLLEATLSHSLALQTREPVEPIVIAAQEGGWAGAISLEVRRAGGETQQWPLELAVAPTGRLTLDVRTAGQLYWSLGPEATAQIAEGEYLVTAILDTTMSPTETWRGRTTSVPVSVEIRTEPSSLTPEQETEKYLLLSDFYSLRGDAAQAIAAVDELLRRQPTNPGGLAARGDFLAEEGRTAEALTLYDRALAEFAAAHPDSPEPPRELLRDQQALRNELFRRQGQAGEPRLAGRIAAQGVHEPGVLFVDLELTNTGTGDARNIRIDRLTFRTLTGAGDVTYNPGLSPRLPMAIESLEVQVSTMIRLFLDVPAGVTSFSISETGSFQDLLGTNFPVSLEQSVVP